MRYLQQLFYVDAVASTGSIRRAAQSLAITSTALNRRILAVEEDLGTPIFERTGKGVRLSVAGEIFIHHIRQQISDMERVRSQIADLSGERRGRVSVACGQALMHSFLPAKVSAYRALHPYVDFQLGVCGRCEATQRLEDFSADIAVIFEPELSADVSVLARLPQSVYAMVSIDHPLAQNDCVRLRDCLQYPLALPSRRSGLRELIENGSLRQTKKPWVALESDNTDFLMRSTVDNSTIAFQISVAFASASVPHGFKAVPIEPQDIGKGSLYVMQQKGRTLPVAAARFLDGILTDLLGSATPQKAEAGVLQDG